ncbi:MAG: DUF3606 domain-containing protein [Proteobacteria bacterium]|nr:DUF3606 domain-containing protein [Pseudomonadota bacterium]
MADDLKIKRPHDATKVNVNQPHEVRYWCDKWGITERQLRDAVAAVGVYVDEIVKYLRGKKLIK